MMMRNTTGRTRRTGAGVLATLAASALAFVGLAMPSASAAQSLPDPSNKGTLVITKHETPTGDEATGLENTEITTPTIQGVKFKVQRVNAATIDLTTSAGWKAASELADSFNASGTLPQGTVLAQGSEITTDANGIATFGNLDLGLYYVTETATPEGVVPSAPFLVTLPMTHPTSLNEWMYTVYVYPKNDRVTVTKSVEDADSVKLGDPVVWSISADVPDNKKQGSDGAESTLESYVIQDVLDPKLSYVSTGDVYVGTTKLDRGDDYTLSEPAGTGGGTLAVTFTEDGIAKLAAAGPNAKVTFTINTTVNAVGEIDNQAVAFINGSSDDHKYVSNKVTTKWGGINIAKTNEAGATLRGAVFEVYYLDSADNRVFIDMNEDGDNDRWTTGTDGKVQISGLRYSDFENGALLESGGRIYYLLEVVAPTGYELLAEPIPVEINDTSGSEVVYAQANVVNVPHNAGFSLPLTGGSGTTWLTIAGLLVLAAAIALMARSRRHTEPAEPLRPQES